MVMPSRNHRTESLERLNRELGEAKGAPLSERTKWINFCELVAIQKLRENFRGRLPFKRCMKTPGRARTNS